MQKIKKVSDLTILNSPEETDYFVGYDVDQADPDKATVLIPVAKGRNIIVDSITALEALTGTVDGQVVQVKGYYAGVPLDMPDYIVDVSSSATLRKGAVVARPEGGRFIWKELTEYDIKCFGAYPLADNDSSESFSDAITYISSLPKGTVDYKGRPTLNLNGGSYKINSGFLTIDTSKIRVDGNGASLSFVDHVGDTTQFVLLTNTGDLEDTYSNPLSAIENLAIIGRGGAETTNNTGILVESTLGGTVSSAGITLRNVSIASCDIGTHHKESSYNITYDTCSIFRNNTNIKITNSPDMFERCVFISCNIFNSTTGIESNAPNGTVYLYGCSLDFNRVHVVMSSGGMELHGCHVEGTLTEEVSPIYDGAMFSVSNNAVFNAYGGWWQFKESGTTTALQEFDVSNSNNGLVTIKDVRFSTFTGGLPFTLNPELMNVINPKPDSTSLLSLRRFDRQYTSFDRFFDDGVFRNDYFLNDTATVFTDRYNNNALRIQIVNDPLNAYSGDYYMEVDKKFGSGSTSQVFLAVPLNDKRRGAGRVRMKALAGSTASVNVYFIYGVLSSGTNYTEYRPYDLIEQRIVGQITKNLSSSYQDFSVSMRERARPSDTHAIMRLDFFNVNNSQVAVDDFNISLV